VRYNPWEKGVCDFQQEEGNEALMFCRKSTAFSKFKNLDFLDTKGKYTV
jgi:hypothetical protein